ncbi:hypothetical protein [Cellulomonas sp. URHD0024]|uniref:hypothetical protein n=1 Tax=Cellulomonas sp. URHD0024 TaxID=1302620 RepID=UPI0004122338|nr:hypothetical protein [Cellulomonas sp. URHD0024]
MRRRTRNIAISICLATALVGSAGAAFVALWPEKHGLDPELWPTETLAVDPAVALAAPRHVEQVDGCPGLTVKTPATATSPARPAGNTAIELAPHHYTLWACLGAVDKTGGARHAVARTLGTKHDLLSFGATRVDSPSGELVRVYRTVGKSGPPHLTDWVVDHGGYTYAFGYLHPVGNAAYSSSVEAMIGSVTWDQP